jgi:hypothetical protein
VSQREQTTARPVRAATGTASKGFHLGPWAALGMMLATVTGLAVALWVIGRSSRFDKLQAAVALPLLLMVGLGSLLMLLTVMVAVLDRFGLTDPRRAFGLPDGSMQAVIALSLVLIFVIASLYLYSDLPPTGARVESQSTRDRFDFAKQLLTTVGTLAVAVAGFYFGARSVEAAQQTQREGATGGSGGATLETGATSAITITEPSSPARLDTAPGTVLAPIRIETTPSGQRTIAFVSRMKGGGCLP